MQKLNKYGNCIIRAKNAKQKISLLKSILIIDILIIELKWNYVTSKKKFNLNSKQVNLDNTNLIELILLRLLIYKLKLQNPLS